uniref:Transposase (putative) YhgA-like domain-containing protein n=1 Tax=Chlorobium chlorochromatii (strain CaD3) TaxID=340177 RepID=Q3ARU8_CHLCH
MINNLLLPNQRDDYDSPWKEAIELYFPEFMAFFYPNAFLAIDWSKPYHFLDQELRSILPEAENGKRIVDKLVQVHLLGGKERCLYIQIEVQGNREADFPRRIFICNYRIFDKYGKPVASFVILTDSDSSWRPTTYSYEFAGSKMTLEFDMVKLLDFEPRIKELLASDNAFALVTAAHLLTQKTREKSFERLDAKSQLIRLLYNKQWTKERVKELFRVIDWFMELPKELEQQLQTEIYNIEEEQKMKYISSIERYAMEKGWSEGMERGILEGMEKGLMEGMERGMAKGKEIGAEQTKLDIARRLVASGISKAEAALLAGVSLETL